jgi:predicted nucleic acid-binding protein
MSAKAFIDTNVLIHAHDVDAAAKHELAKRILQGLWNQRAGALSTQVLQEFYVNVTRKIADRKPIALRKIYRLGRISVMRVIETNAGWARVKIYL